MNKQLNDKEQTFIELVATSLMDNSLSMAQISEEIGISLATAYRWKDKFSMEIGMYSQQKLGLLKPKLYAVAGELLNSQKGTERKQGVDVYLKLEERCQLENEATMLQAEQEKACKMVGVLLEALQINSKEEARQYAGLIGGIMADRVLDRTSHLEKPVYLSVDEMLKRLSL